MRKKPIAQAVEAALEWLWWEWQKIKPGPWWEKTYGGCPVPVRFSASGAVMEIHPSFFKTEQFKRHLDAVKEIREKYRGNPYVSDLP